MKIAFFVTQFPSLSETFIVNQLVDLKKRGHEIKIFSGRKSGDKIIHNQIVEAGLLNDTVYLNSLPSSRTRKLFLVTKALLRCRHFTDVKRFIHFIYRARKNGTSVYDYIFFFDKQDYQILHAHFGINGNYVTKLKDCGLFPKSRFVTTFHGYDLEAEQNNLHPYDRLFQSCNVFTVNSEFARNKLLRIGCSSKKIVKLPVGMDVTFFNPSLEYPCKNRPLNILFVGRLINLKGPDQVIKITGLLKNNLGIHVLTTIIGDGDMKHELIKKVKELLLEEDIVLAGEKSQVEIKEAMEKADIFLFPGRTVCGRAETQGLVLQEAQAMGLPVVVSDAGGMKEGMIDQVTGYVVEEGNAEKFAAVIEHLVNDDSKRKSMGAKGRNFVQQNYAISLLNDRLLSIYQDRTIQSDRNKIAVCY